MEDAAIYRAVRSSSYERLAAIGLTIVAVFSPLYINRRPEVEPELDEEPMNVSSYLPLLLLFLIVAITLSHCLDRSCSRLDPYWIHRAGGSSCGIIIIIILLALILKCRGFPKNWKG